MDMVGWSGPAIV